MTDTPPPTPAPGTGPLTATGHLQAATATARIAVQATAPATPPEIHDQLHVLHELVDLIGQHVERCADATADLTTNPHLRTLTHENGLRTWSHARNAAYRLRKVTGGYVRMLLRELDQSRHDAQTMYLTDHPTS